MARKKDDKTLKKVAPDEPIFILRAQDALASAVVKYWAKLARQLGVDQGKIDSAYLVARAMEAWPDRKLPD